MAFFTQHTDEQYSRVVAERDAALGSLKAETESKQAESDKRVALEKQVADLQAKLTAETNAKNAETAKVQAETAKLQAETAKAKDLQEENDLLLAQLHQVQEELERYYLKNKDLESSVSEVTVSLRNARHLLVNSKLAGAASRPKLLTRG